MRCPTCESENLIGAIYCAACGEKLEITSERAHVEAVAEVSHDNWRKACIAISRTLFLFSLVFVASLLFNAYARREVIADFSASATLPRPAPMSLPSSIIPPSRLAVPIVTTKSVLKPEKLSEKGIVSGLAETARDRLNCIVVVKVGAIIVRGAMLFRDDKEIHIITAWPPTARIRTVNADSVDLKDSKLPE